MNRASWTVVLTMMLGAACAEPLVASGDDGIDALPDAPAAPASNPTSQEKAELGKLLFWDAVLSGDRDTSCASCHDPAYGYADGIARAVGTGGAIVARNTPTVLHAAWNGWTGKGPFRPEDAPMFWDNRAQSLETQAVGPLHAESEMRGQHLADADVAQELPRRLRAIPAYSQRFAAAFGSAEITEERIAMAIASFERTLARGSSPFDRFMRGEQDALSIAQKRGMVGFFEAGCAKCHGGPMFSDFKVHALGVDSSFHGVADRGDGQGRFRTPSLRNIEKTAPYMHDGSLATLDEVYDFYAQIDRGLDPALSGIGPVVGTARADMTAFLRALTDTASTDDAPTEVPSGLPVGGTRRARR